MQRMEVWGICESGGRKTSWTFLVLDGGGTVGEGGAGAVRGKEVRWWGV